MAFISTSSIRNRAALSIIRGLRYLTPTAKTTTITIRAFHSNKTLQPLIINRRFLSFHHLNGLRSAESSSSSSSAGITGTTTITPTSTSASTTSTPATLVAPATSAAEVNAVEPVILPPYLVNTHEITQRLSKHMSREQAEILTQSMVVKTQEQMFELEESLLEKSRYELQNYSVRSDSQALKVEFISHQKSQNNILKSESIAIQRELDQINQKFRDDLVNTRTNLSIDINNQKYEIREDSKIQERVLFDTQHKLMYEVSDLKADIEASKFHITKYVIGSVTVIILTFVLISLLQDDKSKNEEEEEMLEEMVSTA